MNGDRIQITSLEADIENIENHLICMRLRASELGWTPCAGWEAKLVTALKKKKRQLEHLQAHLLAAKLQNEQAEQRKAIASQLQAEKAAHHKAVAELHGRNNELKLERQRLTEAEGRDFQRIFRAVVKETMTPEAYRALIAETSRRCLIANELPTATA